MTHWTKFRSVSEIEQFQIDFREFPEAKKEKILEEMIAVIDEYVKSITVLDHNASTSREEPPLLRKRRGRAKRTRATT